MKIRVYENGILAGARFFPLLDGLYLSILKAGAREEFLHRIQRKYVTIDLFNSACRTSYNFFEEIPFFDSLRPDFSNSALALECFEASGFSDGLCHSDLNHEDSPFLVLENVSFRNYMRSKNRYFPLNLDFLEFCVLPGDLIFDDPGSGFLSNWKLRRLVLFDLYSKKVCFNYRLSDILHDELLSYQVVVLSSGFFISDALRISLRAYCDGGGNLVVLWEKKDERGFFWHGFFPDSPIMEIGPSVFGFAASVFTVGSGRVILVSIEEEGRGHTGAANSSIFEFVKDVTGISPGGRPEHISDSQMFCNVLEQIVSGSGDLFPVIYRDGPRVLGKLHADGNFVREIDDMSRTTSGLCVDIGRLGKVLADYFVRFPGRQEEGFESEGSLHLFEVPGMNEAIRRK